MITFSKIPPTVYKLNTSVVNGTINPLGTDIDIVESYELGRGIPKIRILQIMP